MASTHTETAAVRPRGQRIPQWTLGERIAKARKTASMEQGDLGRLLGVSASMVSKWERDLTEPRVSMLLAISETCDVDAQWLLGGGTVSGSSVFGQVPHLELIRGGRTTPAPARPLGLYLASVKP